MAKWEKGHAENLIMNGKGKWFISYQDFSMVNKQFKKLNITHREMPETAIVVNNKKYEYGRKFYILNGDHRKEYEKLVPKGLRACKEYFNKTNGKSFWTNS